MLRFASRNGGSIDNGRLGANQNGVARRAIGGLECHERLGGNSSGTRVGYFSRVCIAKRYLGQRERSFVRTSPANAVPVDLGVCGPSRARFHPSQGRANAPRRSLAVQVLRCRSKKWMSFNSLHRGSRPRGWEGAAAGRAGAGPSPSHEFRAPRFHSQFCQRFLWGFAPWPTTCREMAKAVEKARPSIVEARTPDEPRRRNTVGTVT